MKKFISILLAVSVLVSAFAIGALADDDVVTFAVASDLHYNDPEEELTATNDHPLFWHANRRAAMDNESGFIIDEFLRQAEEAEYERKRMEAERRKAAGLIEDNKNTSKKKKQAQEKQLREEMKAAAIAAEKAERRERLGVQEAEIPASQVGNRRYARGRAYDPDRFKVEE